MKKNLFSRLLSFALAVCLVFAFTACNQDDSVPYVHNHDNALKLR